MPAFLELIDKIYCQSCRRHVRIHMQGTIKGPWVLDPVQTKLTIHYISPRLDKSCTHLELDCRLGTEEVVPGAAVVGNGWLWNLGTPPVAAWLIELAMGSCVTVVRGGGERAMRKRVHAYVTWTYLMK